VFVWCLVLSACVTATVCIPVPLSLPVVRLDFWFCVFGRGRLDGCFVQLSGWLGWCWCRAVSGLICGSPAC
jgi:hypothetical protein